MVAIVDELADLMMTAPRDASTYRADHPESPRRRIHLVLATSARVGGRGHWADTNVPSRLACLPTYWTDRPATLTRRA